MSLLHPASQRAQRAINITTVAVLAAANIAIIIFFLLIFPWDVPNKFLIGSLIIGVALSFFKKPRLGGLILLIPIIIFGVFAVWVFYNTLFKY